MRQRILLPAAVASAGLLGGAVGAGAWETLDDDPEPTAAVSPTATTTANRGAASSLAELYRRAAPGVVEIEAGGQEEGFDPFGRRAEPTATGSGFVIDEEGHIVTNQHVVGNTETVRVRFANGDEARARVVGSDASTDVALLVVTAATGSGSSSSASQAPTPTAPPSSPAPATAAGSKMRCLIASPSLV